MPTVELQPTGGAGIDAELREDSPTTNYGASFIALSVRYGAGVERRTLLKFDLSSIPATATVTNATLWLYDAFEGSNTGLEIGVYRQLRDWVENEATWNQYSTGNNWGAAGGFDAADCEQTEISTALNALGWVEFTLDTGAVQDWIDGTLPNYGVMIKRVSGTGGASYTQCFSSDYATDTSLCPKLIIGYSLPAATTIAPQRGASYQIRLKDQAGALAAIIEDYDSLYYRRAVNGVGGYNLTLSMSNAAYSLFELDGQVEIWRRIPEYGLDWYPDFEGFHRHYEYSIDPDGILWFTSRGVGYNHFLWRRNIYYYAGSSQAEKSAPGETVMKEFVNENAGPGATSPPRLIRAGTLTGLAMEADAAGGNTVSKGAAWANLLATLQDLAPQAGGDFQVVGTGPATFEFRFYAGQLGTDRSSTVVFSLQNGNIIEPQLIQDRRTEQGFMLAAGQGERTNRVLVSSSDATRMADSPWNDIEGFTDGRNYTTTAGLTAAANEALAAGEPRRELRFKPKQTAAYVYGVHYDLGDLVTAQFEDYSETHKISAVTIRLSKNAGETINIETERV